MITNAEVERFHAAAKIIEDDGCQGYYACRNRFGADIVGVALVVWLRRNIGSHDEWPVSKELAEEVNCCLRQDKRLEKKFDTDTENQ